MARLGEFGRPLDVDSAEGREYLAQEPDTFLFHGDEYTIPARVSALPLLRFARDARDLDAEGKRLGRFKVKIRNDAQAQRALEWEAELRMREQASLMDYLESMILEEEWADFEKAAARTGADVDELMGVANQIIAAITSRPTRLPSGSPAGQHTTDSGSQADSPSSGDLNATPAEPTEPTEPTEQREATYAEVAAASGISERDAQRWQWAAQMEPVGGAG